MNLMVTFLFLVIPLVDLSLWIAWTNASSSIKRYLLMAIAAVAIPQAAFVFYVLVRIGVTFFAGAEL